MTTRRVAGVALAASVAIVGLTACGDDGGEGAVPVSMTEYAYDPETIAVEADGALRITNDGAETHNLTVPALGKGVELPPGGEATLDLDGQAPGTYEVICDLTGHAEQGMVAQLTIG